ncbi:hypothetical protein F7725_014828, partial [Dissostichus mawsoni]
MSSPPLPQNSSAASCSSSSLHREVPSGSLSHLLSSSPTPPPPCRRRSLPSGGGYSKLTHGEDESFESTSSHRMGQRSGECDGQRDIDWSVVDAGNRLNERHEEQREPDDADQQQNDQTPHPVLHYPLLLLTTRLRHLSTKQCAYTSSTQIQEDRDRVVSVQT